MSDRTIVVPGTYPGELKSVEVKWSRSNRFQVLLLKYDLSVAGVVVPVCRSLPLPSWVEDSHLRDQKLYTLCQTLVEMGVDLPLADALSDSDTKELGELFASLPDRCPPQLVTVAVEEFQGEQRNRVTWSKVDDQAAADTQVQTQQSLALELRETVRELLAYITESDPQDAWHGIAKARRVLAKAEGLK